MKTGPIDWRFFARIGFCAAVLSPLLSLPAAPGRIADVESLEGKKIAVTVFAQNELSENLVKTAQSRMEDILLDNGVFVLDQKKAEELGDVFLTLEDPGAFITAETFVENAGKFDIEGLVAVYLSTDVSGGIANYYSATAHADIRYIDNQTAKVQSLSTPAMGTRGFPPSDGLTRTSASINAVQRAVDAACDMTGFQIAEWTRAKSVDLELKPSGVYRGGGIRFRPPERNKGITSGAPLEQETWSREEVTATAVSDSGDIVAVGGYIRNTDFHRRPQRLYGSRIHILDRESDESILTLVTSPVAKKEPSERNTKRVIDIAFLGGWRFLTAVTGNHLFMWDLEKGTEISKLPIPAEPKSMAVANDEEGSFVVVDTKSGKFTYRVERKTR